MRIECSEAALEYVRGAAVAGVCMFPHGGVEVGGVLFGSVSGDVIRVEEARAVECTYSGGPSFTLQCSGEAAFRRVTTGRAELVPVGWYHSHTRSGLELSAEDAALHDRLFPEPWQVALLVRPEPFGTADAVFHVNTPGGLERSPQGVFKLRPPERAGLRPRRAHTRLAERPVRPEPPPAPDPMPAAHRTRQPWLWWAVVAAMVILAAASWSASVLLRAPALRPLALRVIDAGGELHITWDRDAAPLRDAAGGTIEIDDGAEHVLLPFSTERLRAGTVTYTRRTGDVEVRMKLLGPHQVQESVRIVGLAPASEVSARAAQAGPASPAKAQARPPRPAQQRNPPVAVEPRARTETPPARGSPRTRRPAQFAGLPEPAQSRAAPLPPPPEVRPSAVPAGPAPAPVSGVLQRPPAARTSYAGPASGRLIWVGRLERGGRLSIQSSRPSSGLIQGELPGVPVRISAHAAELGGGRLRIFASSPAAARAAREPAGPANGWNATSYTWDPRRLRDVLVTEVPSAGNGWKGISLRGGGSTVSVVIIDWQVVQEPK